MNEILLRCQTSGAKAVFQADGATLCSLTLGESSNKNNHRQAEELDVVVAVSDNALATIHHPTSCPYVGIIGRVANRIKNGRFPGLNSTFIQLPSINNGPNHLHGGSVGFDKRTWTVAQSTENSVTFTLHSPHLEEGYPGSLNVQAKWTLDTSKNDNSTCTILRLDLQAESADELESIVNLTNHTYFNLTGFKDPSILNHRLTIPNMTGYLDVDESQIPTGELITFDEDQHGDPMDFRKPRIIDNTIDQVQQFKGYDHFYMLKPPSSVGDGEEEQDLVLAVEVETSEIKMQIFTNQIGFQLYTGNWLDGKIPLKSIHSSNNYSSTSSTGYGKYSGVCFEPSAPPDSINHPQWRDQVIISSSKKHPYKNIILYKFSKVKE